MAAKKEEASITHQDIVFLNDPGPIGDLVGCVGGKSANLMLAIRANVKKPVPPGFTITTAAFQRHLASIGLDDCTDPAKVRKGLLTSDISEDLKNVIIRGIELLGTKAERGLGIVVRSSATMEDMAGASFAGQQDTFLHVKNEAELFRCIRKCWASAFDKRAVAYRRERLDHAGPHEEAPLQLPSVAVLIQRKVRADLAGVAFSQDPFGSGCAVVESVRGLGESLVSGTRQPARAFVKRGDGESGKGNVMLLHRTGAKSGALDEDAAVEITALSLEMERVLGTPADIEWAMAKDGALFLLQARPITSALAPSPMRYVQMLFSEMDDRTKREYLRSELESLKKSNKEWTQRPLNERIVMPMCPWESSILHLTMGPVFLALLAIGVRMSPKVRPIALWFERPYLDLTYLRQVFSKAPEAVDMIMYSGSGKKAHLKPRLSPFTIGVAQRLLTLVPNTLELWQEEEGLFDKRMKELEAVDIGSLDLEGAVELMDRNLDALTPVMDVHFKSVILTEALYNGLVEVLRMARIQDPEGTTTKLTGGLEGNATVRTNMRLLELSGMMRRGEDVTSALTTFLGEYGHRDPVHNLMFPSWREDPDVVKAILRAMSASRTELMTRAAEKAKKQRLEAERSVDKALRNWTGRILPVRAAIFKRMLAHTQAYMVLRENQQFAMGRAFPIMRQTLLRIGGMLSERGELESEFEAFFLRHAELKAIAKGGPVPGRSEVEGRMRRFYAYLNTDAPVTYTPSDHEAIAKALLAIHRDDGEQGKGTRRGRGIKGVGVSHGKYRGKARVLLDPKDLSSLRQGEVLVCPTTNPAWTPVFHLAGAIVTDIGGMLSHGAVVAREYGIPAVLGTRNATAVIRDGDIVEVDGGKGTVRKVSRRVAKKVKK